jgi:hypothetical protein
MSETIKQSFTSASCLPDNSNGFASTHDPLSSLAPLAPLAVSSKEAN